ncbi:hypothetical protein LCGC14_1401030 [marine sediment metagenome]|uniref:site-specific DNA-methyltransferase (cytosine-N(4)-specific) n=1 Tax=marine sediment metagenome TaxID=412755 RepID=A0A0F9JX39_9ZZZZ
MSEWSILEGDVMAQIADIEAASVQTCITSPPYWGLRDYGHDGQLGLEATPEEYTEKMVTVFREVRRVLRDDGTLWCNLGDSYVSSPAGNKPGQHSTSSLTNPARQDLLHHGKHAGMGCARPTRPTGLKPKDLVGIPWRVAFALQADGWYLRSDIIWAKPNPMPESVTDRPTKSHEYLFLLSKSARYRYDAGAISEPSTTGDNRRPFGVGQVDSRGSGHDRGGGSVRETDVGSRNRRTVWTIPTQPFPGAHFAVFPPALVEPCVLAGSREGDLVLDPFAGAGTVGVVCRKHHRRFVGIEINPEYAALARGRLGGWTPTEDSADGTPDLWSE